MRPKGVGGWFVRRIIKKANLGTEGQEVAANGGPVVASVGQWSRQR